VEVARRERPSCGRARSSIKPAPRPTVTPTVGTVASNTHTMNHHREQGAR